MSQYPPTNVPLTAYPTVKPTSSQPNNAPYNLPTNFASNRSGSRTSGEATPTDKDQSYSKPSGRRHHNGRDAQNGEREAHLNAMGRFYEKLLAYSASRRYTLYIVPIAVLLMVPILIGATAATNSKIGGVRVVWFFTWFEASWLTFWAMKLVAKIIPVAFAYFAGVVSSETKRYARVLENLETTIVVFGWVGISFVLYEVLFSTAAAGNSPLHWTTVFKKVLGAIFVSVIIFTIERVFVQLVSVNYHERSFNNKIEECKRYVYLLSLLFDASRALFPMYGDSFIEEDYIIHSNIEAFFKKEAIKPEHHRTSLHKHQRVISGIGRFGGKIHTAFGNIAQEITGNVVLNPKAAQSIVVESLEKSKSSRALAQRLWLSFVEEGRNELHLSDLQEVLGSDAEEVARECFEMLDPDGNTDVSLDEMIMRVTELSTARKAIAKSMHDVSQAIQALDNVASSVCFLISIFVLGKYTFTL